MEPSTRRRRMLPVITRRQARGSRLVRRVTQTETFSTLPRVETAETAVPGGAKLDPEARGVGGGGTHTASLRQGPRSMLQRHGREHSLTTQYSLRAAPPVKQHARQ